MTQALPSAEFHLLSMSSSPGAVRQSQTSNVSLSLSDHVSDAVVPVASDLLNVVHIGYFSSLYQLKSLFADHSLLDRCDVLSPFWARRNSWSVPRWAGPLSTVAPVLLPPRPWHRGRGTHFARTQPPNVGLMPSFGFLSLSTKYSDISYK